MSFPASHFERRIVIVGVGLIGGSIAAAVRRWYPNCCIAGVGRSEERLKLALEAGLIDEYETEYSSSLFRDGSLVVICLPVNLIPDAVSSIAAVCAEDVAITDAGSVKGTICEAIAGDSVARRLFAGAHPIAGGENGGFEFAEADLFVNRVCVVVDPAADASAGLKDRVAAFWRGLGCRVRTMAADEHDRVLARTSHLPHVMAAATTSTVGRENLAMCGSGFRDATRIAAGSASLWKAILASNRQEVVAAIRAAEAELREFRIALDQRSDDRLEELLSQAAEYRSALDC